jgi:hypothetical protein
MNEYVEIYFKKPISLKSKKAFLIMMLIGNRKGNMAYVQRNRLIGVKLHKNDLEDLKKIVNA